MKNAAIVHSSEHGEKVSFFSLKWKITLLSSLILLAVVMLFCMVSYYGLRVNFENQREVEFKRYEREVDALVKNASRNLRQMAEMIPFLDGMNEALRESDKDKEKINQVFDQHWALLQFHKGIELVRFYNKSNQLIASWDVLGTDTKAADTVLSWVGKCQSA